MIRILIIACLCVRAEASSAQVFDQKATQQKLLTQQIAALVLYAREARQGYQTVQQGLATIKAITSGELALHTLFIAALAGINPQIVLYVQSHSAIIPQSVR